MLQKIMACFLSWSLLGCSTPKPLSSRTQRSDAVDQVLLSSPPQTIHVSGPPNLSGNWKSKEAEPAGNGQFLQRTVSFSFGHITQTSTWSQDRQLKKPIFIYRIQGEYLLEKKPEASAQQVHFLSIKPIKKTIQLLRNDHDFISSQHLENCHLPIKKEKDITELGCGDFLAVKFCSEEFDVARLEASELFLGERPANNDVCAVDKRPESFAQPLVQF